MRYDTVAGMQVEPLLQTPVGRWANLVVSVAAAQFDTPTLDHWASLVRASRHLVCSRCRVAAARPKDSLDFGRLMRAIRIGNAGEWRPEEALDVIDDRTLMALLAKGGLAPYFHGERPPLAVLFHEHRFAVPPTGVLLLVEIVNRDLLEFMQGRRP